MASEINELLFAVAQADSDYMGPDTARCRIRHTVLGGRQGALKTEIHRMRADGREDPYRGGLDHDAMMALADALLALQDAMYQPGEGTWIEVTVTINEDGTFDQDFNYDQDPADGRSPGFRDADPRAYRLELRAHPRPEARIPDWWREKAGLEAGAEPDAAGAPAGVQRPASPGEASAASCLEQIRRYCQMTLALQPPQAVAMEVGFSRSGTEFSSVEKLLEATAEELPWTLENMARPGTDAVADPRESALALARALHDERGKELKAFIVRAERDGSLRAKLRYVDGSTEDLLSAAPADAPSPSFAPAAVPAPPGTGFDPAGALDDEPGLPDAFVAAEGEPVAETAPGDDRWLQALSAAHGQPPRRWADAAGIRAWGFRDEPSGLWHLVSGGVAGTGASGLGYELALGWPGDERGPDSEEAWEMLLRVAQLAREQHMALDAFSYLRLPGPLGHGLPDDYQGFVLTPDPLLRTPVAGARILRLLPTTGAECEQMATADPDRPGHDLAVGLLKADRSLSFTRWRP